MSSENLAHDEYWTLAGRCSAELTEQRSRFLGVASPCGTQQELRALLDEVSAAQPGATHYCWAYRLGYPDHAQEHSSDAGEPAGTAGPPMAGVLAFHQLWNVAIIAVRHFGGVKLGIPGLQDAYRGIARLTLAAGKAVLRRPMCALAFDMPYAAYNILEYHLKKCGGRWSGQAFGARVRGTAHVPRACAAEFEASARAAGAAPVHGAAGWQNE